MLKGEVRELSSESGRSFFYCGCCPWNVCPNTWPAFQILLEMGFQELKVLYLPKNLQQEVQKGFPTEKRAAAADGRQD